jgi:Coenzyme PQQ synthesis protein D (PqqD)
MRPTPKQRILESEELIGDVLFLYDEQTGGVHTLNSGAAMVWFLCDGNRDLREIPREISVAGSLPQEQVLPQVQETVAQFQALGLLEG